MALDHQQILLLVNVITITAFTSLTLIWYIRKWDREALAKRIIAQRASTKAQELSVIEQESVMEKESEPEHIEKVPAAARVSLPAMKPEISQVASRRTDGWMAPSVAQWNQRLSA